MSITPKNLLGIQYQDYVCQNEGRACAIMHGQDLIFEFEHSVLDDTAQLAVTNYLKVLNVSTVYYMWVGYDTYGNKKRGPAGAVNIYANVGGLVTTTPIPLPAVNQGDIWYLYLRNVPFIKSMLKVLLEWLE